MNWQKIEPGLWSAVAWREGTAIFRSVLVKGSRTIAKEKRNGRQRQEGQGQGSQTEDKKTGTDRKDSAGKATDKSSLSSLATMSPKAWMQEGYLYGFHLI